MSHCHVEWVFKSISLSNESDAKAAVQVAYYTQLASSWQ